jgi:hypothetical protein
MYEKRLSYCPKSNKEILPESVEFFFFSQLVLNGDKVQDIIRDDIEEKSEDIPMLK